MSLDNNIKTNNRITVQIISIDLKQQSTFESGRKIWYRSDSKTVGQSQNLRRDFCISTFTKIGCSRDFSSKTIEILVTLTIFKGFEIKFFDNLSALMISSSSSYFYLICSNLLTTSITKLLKINFITTKKYVYKTKGLNSFRESSIDIKCCQTISYENIYIYLVNKKDKLRRC